MPLVTDDKNVGCLGRDGIKRKRTVTQLSGEHTAPLLLKALHRFQGITNADGGNTERRPHGGANGTGVINVGAIVGHDNR